MRPLGDAGARLEARVEELQRKLALTVEEAGLLSPENDNPLTANSRGTTWDPVKLRGPCISYFDDSGHLQVSRTCQLWHFQGQSLGLKSTRGSEKMWQDGRLLRAASCLTTSALTAAEEVLASCVRAVHTLCW